jgi:hypothetical protein
VVSAITGSICGLFWGDAGGHGLGGFLRFEPNFGLFPFFPGLYELGMHAEEGPVGGGVVADEESEVSGDS